MYHLTATTFDQTSESRSALANRHAMAERTHCKPRELRTVLADSERMQPVVFRMPVSPATPAPGRGHSLQLSAHNRRCTLYLFIYSPVNFTQLDWMDQLRYGRRRALCSWICLLPPLSTTHAHAQAPTPTNTSVAVDLLLLRADNVYNCGIRCV
jgi:hypothetical protein